MKTPEEIKKGLECCSNVNFVCNEECPYYKSLSEGEDCCLEKNADALAYIWRLEAQNAELVRKTEQLQRERDALAKDVSGYCPTRAFIEDWEWRGVQEQPKQEGENDV